jgi:DNA helicase-2/ATP-dependent DNA helicase PcrA
MADAHEIELHQVSGPALLLAGPGTGKTYQLAKRIKFLVEDHKVEPTTIAVITFTAAAAANMRNRISDPRKAELCVKQELQPDLICTMHSLGYAVIRDNLPLLSLAGVPSVVRDDSTKSMLMKDAAQLRGHRRKDAEAPTMCRQYGHCQPEESQKCRICNTYEAILRSCNAIDYDDQILLACRILRENPKVAESWRTRTRHLLVDEYQDINAGQYELIRILSEGQEDGLFVVGDDDQSIYSWRGGSPEFIREFEKHFGQNATVTPLRRSFRCPRIILEGAFAIVKEYDKGRRDKGAFTYNMGDGNPIVVHNVASDKKEAAAVKAIIAEALPSKDVLVLVPNRNYARLICDALRRTRLAFVAPEPAPGEGLPVVERFVAWVREPQDNLALRESIENMLTAETSPLPSPRVRKPEKLEAREKGFATVSSLWKAVIEKKQSLWQALGEWGDADGVLGYLKEGLDSLKSAVDAGALPSVLSCVADRLRPWRSFDAFADEIQNWVSRSDQAGAGQASAVRVMTFQGAKGLEADVVCIIGVEEGTVPRDGADLEEQARLFFVSLTRAKTDLHLFHARSRSGAVSFQQIHKPNGPHTLKRSRFVDAMPSEVVKSRFHR